MSTTYQTYGPYGPQGAEFDEVIEKMKDADFKYHASLAIEELQRSPSAAGPDCDALLQQHQSQDPEFAEWLTGLASRLGFTNKDLFNDILLALCLIEE